MGHPLTGHPLTDELPVLRALFPLNPLTESAETNLRADR